MKFIPNEIRIMFSKFLALLWFLILILKNLMFDLWIFIHKIKRCFWWKIAKTVKNGCWKILEKFNYMSCWKCTFWSIEEESRTNWVRQKLYDEILRCLDRLRIPFNWSNVNFNRSNRNQESFEWGRNFVMNFFLFQSIWVIGSTNQRHWILNFHLLFD